MTTDIDHTAPTIDTRELVQAAAEIADLIAELEECETDEDRAEYQALIDEWHEEHPGLANFAAECEATFTGYYSGTTLISADHFVEYAKDFADGTGAINSDLGWPYSHIDWKAAAAELLQDYTEVEWNGVTFHGR